MAHNVQGVPRTYEYDIEKLHIVTTAKAAIMLDDGVPIPCSAISVGTTGAYTINNPDGTTQLVTLNSGVMYYISQSILPTGAGTVIVWY